MSLFIFLCFIVSVCFSYAHVGDGSHQHCTQCGNLAHSGDCPADKNFWVGLGEAIISEIVPGKTTSDYLTEERRVTQTHPCPSRDVERAELRKHLRAAIQQLTPLRKQVFLLYYAQDLSIKQIATRLNRSEGTIKSHLRNARFQLREDLIPFLV